MSQANERHSQAPNHPGRARIYRRDFQTIYLAALTLCLIGMPFVRLARMACGRHRPRKPSMIQAARAEAGIIASYALMGY